MKNKNICWLIPLAFTLLTAIGCGKTGVDCLTNSGEIILQERELHAFDSIEVHDYVNLFLSQDSSYKVSVEAGKNVIAGIETTVENRQLVVRNTNTCNWVRNYTKPINVYISAPNLWKINYNSSGNITSLNTMKTDSLKLEVWGGCGRIDLDLDLYQGFFYLQLGTADIHLSGNCGVVSMSTGDFGLLDARNLRSGFVFVSNKSSNDCYVQVFQELNATIQSIGNIYYTGDPKEIHTIINGSGSVIPF
ncbi:MAG: head GIN domain-containing protein [Bacteroidota bacterium]